MLIAFWEILVDGMPFARLIKGGNFRLPGGGQENAMILSVSRRTDVPSFYFDWFVNRLREGWLLVRNPFNPSRVSRVALSPGAVECIVFWTKNPAPMLDKLDALEGYPYYIQYTLNAYGKDMEGRLPELAKRLDVFLRLSEKLGSERVVWRYSPVLLNGEYTEDFHCEAFEKLAGALRGHTLQCKLSIIELYRKIRSRMEARGVAEPDEGQSYALAGQLRAIAARNDIVLSACGKPDLRPAGIPASSCVDGELIRKITGRAMAFRKDPGQRGVCNCVESVDIGTYHTCLNGCAYCYANHSHASAARGAARYDPRSPFLCDAPRPDDIVTDRKIRLHGTRRQNTAASGKQLPLLP